MDIQGSFGLKLERACEHLDSLKTEARAWKDTKPCTLVDEPDTEPPTKEISNEFEARRLRIDRADPVPAQFSLIVGDCVFNLRAALDHVVYALARATTPNMSSRQIANSEFPIFKDRKKFADVQDRKIGCLSPTAKAMIEGLQPYHRGHNSTTHPLWQIHDLNRIDKHRTVAVCGIVHDVVDGQRLLFVNDNPNIGAKAYWKSIEVPLEVGAIPVQYAGKPINPQRKMSMDSEIPVQIIFEPGSPLSPLPVIETLQTLCEFVRKDIFAPILERL